ncbi:MAG TPA: DUF3486 family protein [Stellaceae bacterium]
MSGRGRLSSLDLLPDEAQDDIIWACQELSKRRRTQEDIRFELNDRLEARGLEGVSKSAFNRKATRLAAIQRRMQDAREIFQGLTPQLTPEKVDENTIALGEMIKTLIQELMDDDHDTKQTMELARAFQATVQAQKISSDRRRKLEDEMTARASKAVDTVAKAKGLSAETAEQIKAQILGIATERRP